MNQQYYLPLFSWSFFPDSTFVFVGLVVLLFLGKKLTRSALSWYLFCLCHMLLLFVPSSVFIIAIDDFFVYWMYYFHQNYFFLIIGLLLCWLFIYLVVFLNISLALCAKRCLIFEQFHSTYSSLLNNYSYFLLQDNRMNIQTLSFWMAFWPANMN